MELNGSCVWVVCCDDALRWGYVRMKRGVTWLERSRVMKRMITRWLTRDDGSSTRSLNSHEHQVNINQLSHHIQPRQLMKKQTKETRRTTRETSVASSNTSNHSASAERGTNTPPSHSVTHHSLFSPLFLSTDPDWLVVVRLLPLNGLECPKSWSFSLRRHLSPCTTCRLRPTKFPPFSTSP